MHRSHRSPLPVAVGRGLALACLASGLAGCVFSPLQPATAAGGHVEPKAAAPKSPAPAPAPVHARSTPPAQQHPRPQTARQKAPQHPATKPVVLLLSADDARYRDIVSALRSHLSAGGFDVVKVAGRDLKWALYALGPNQKVYAVAVGDKTTALSARRLHVPTVYCAMPDAHSDGNAYANMHGVAALPPLDLQLRAWKRVSPRLKRVALILGPGHEETAARAQLAARSAHLELTYRSVASDQEAMYVFKRLAPQVDGLWLLPDTVLSPRAIKTMLDEARRDRIQSLVFTPSLFRWGALLSAGSTAKNVALTVTGVLDRLVNEPQSVPASTPLSALELRVNESVAAAFGIHAPSTSWIVRTGAGS